MYCEILTVMQVNLHFQNSCRDGGISKFSPFRIILTVFFRKNHSVTKFILQKVTLTGLRTKKSRSFHLLSLTSNAFQCTCMLIKIESLMLNHVSPSMHCTEGVSESSGGECLLPGGCQCCFLFGCQSHHALRQYTPTCEQNDWRDRCKNITFTILRLRWVWIMKWILI